MNESTPESVEFTNQEKLILASQSEARITMLRDAGLDFEVKAARLDEEALTAGLIARDHGDGVRALSNAFITGYVERHWDQIRWSVGCYEYERAGVQLFDKIEGDRWTIIGLPMLPLLAWLRLRGSIMS